MLLSHLRQLLRAVAAASVIASLAQLSASGQGAALGQFEGHGDIGAPKIAGSAVYNAVTQEYSLSAGGVNMWAQKDEFHFVWKRMTGDFILQARVELIGKGVDPHRKVGLMVRPSQDADAPYVDGMVHGDGLTSLQFRRTKGAITEQVESPVKGADVIQIERKGADLHLLGRQVRRALHHLQVSDVSLGDDVLVGLALCSHNGDVTERAIFKDVRLVRPDEGRLQAVSPITSAACSRSSTCRADGSRSSTSPSSRSRRRTGRPTAARSSTTPAGASRGADVSIASTSRPASPRSSTPAPTISNNNDHVLSFDGTMLGISDQSIQGTGSTIYTVPVSGGAPKRITQLAPSYLHGWSPDGEVAGLHGRPGRRVRHLPHRVGRQRRRGQPDQVEGARRWPGVFAGRQVHLLQLGAERHDADLAHAAGRLEPGTDHQ